jgi:uncharacterized membrane protein YciS (DUF1049 family)
MNQNNYEASQMADIFSVLTPQTVLSDWLLFIVIAACFSILLLVCWRLWLSYQAPLLKLERYLKRGKLSPSEAAHHLAKIMTTDDKKIKKKIDQLRFQRQAPKVNDLLSLIDKVKYDH